MFGPAGEVERVYNHFLGVEALMAARDVRTLDPDRGYVQSLLLDELGRYRRAGRYPKNREFRGKRVPCFIDDAGTRCAVAHLLEVSGESELACEIARSRNYARVRELADETRFVAWLEATGFTLEEARRIQPAYCFITAAAACFCMHVSPTLAEAVVVSSGPGDAASVRIERIEGLPTGLKVGDEVPAHVYSTGQGGRVLLSVSAAADAGAPPELWDAEVRLDVNGSTSTCQTNEFTRTHPISEDVVFQAVTASDQSACENRLAQEGANWKGSQCDPQTGGGCGIGREEQEHSSMPALTTAGVLAAVLRYRGRRGRSAKAERSRPGAGGTRV